MASFDEKQQQQQQQHCIHLRKFDPSRVTCPKTVIAMGKRATGKSHLVKDILYRNRATPVAVAISPTERRNKFYESVLPSACIYDEYTSKNVQMFLDRQKTATNLVLQEEILCGTDRRTTFDPSGILVMDDCFYDSAWTNDKNLRSLFLNGRPYKSLFLLTMQYPLSMPISLRTNVDFVFIFRDNNVQTRKRIYENYANNAFTTFDMFCEVMDQYTQDHGCLVIDQTSFSNKLEDQVFWYRAEPNIPDFRMMCEPSRSCPPLGTGTKRRRTSCDKCESEDDMILM